MFDGTLAGPSSNEAGLPKSGVVNSVQQKPLEDVSIAYSLDDAQVADRCDTQYFEMVGNRGIYHMRWLRQAQPHK